MVAALRNRLVAALAGQRALLRTRAGRTVAVTVATLAGMTLIALVIMWPSGTTTRASGVIVQSRDIVPAQVRSVASADCPVEARPGCERVEITVGRGNDTAESYLILPGDEARPRLSPGDRIKVTPNFAVLGLFAAGDAVDPSQAPYGFVDFERERPLLVLAVLFVVLVAALGRRVGIASLLAVGVGLYLVTAFVVPAILEGVSPLAVALVGSFAAMYASVVPVYGIGAKSLATLLGTAVSLLATGALAVIFVHAAHITGTAGEDATLVTSLGGGRLSLQGLVLAGMIIGALGVLSDVTVSQASTVLALRRADPAQSFARLYRAAVDVGRDHLGATVNTLVFAYAGASLPLLLIFTSEGLALGDALNRETVAAEIVAALVGSIGLVLSVPLTTLAATVLALRLPAETLPADDHAHAH
jgi:uncharacterized membrane protein